MTDCSVLIAEDLCKVYSDAGTRIVVLDHVHLTVQTEEMVAIMGTSGAGKTTLLQLLGGLDQPTSGSVWVAGKIGFIYQFHHLLPEFDALENVCLPLLLSGESVRYAKEKAMYYIEQVGLHHRSTHRVGELSGGERQRIAIARALVIEPKCILADEPTGNLDEARAHAIIDLLLNLNQRLHISFVMVTHNTLLAQKMHKIYRLEHGHLQHASY